MMKKLFFTLLIATTGLLLAAQSAGDYRSVVATELDWEDNTSWEKYDVLNGWEPSADYPAMGGTDITYTVTIQAGSDVIFGMINPFTLNVGNTSQAGEIVIQNGGVLTIFDQAYDLNVSEMGALTINGTLYCTGDIVNNGDMAVSGAYFNTTP